MSDYLIHQALTQSVIDLALGLEIAHENRDFDPPKGEDWLWVTRIPNDRESLTKAEMDEERGIYQVTYFTPSGDGIGTALANIDTILQNYQHNATFTAGAQDVVIVNVGRNAGRNENGWWRTDISVTYKADIQRI